MAHTKEMIDMLRLRGYPSIPISPSVETFCNKAVIHEAMDASEEDYGGQTQVCLTCGKAWSCEYAGANQQINNVVCPDIPK